MAATSVEKGPESNLFELPEALSKARPFESLCSRGNHKGSHESHLDQQKECFQSPPAVQRKFRNLIPHMLALQRVKTDMKKFLREKAREYCYDDAREETVTARQHIFMSPQITREIFFNAGKFKMIQSLERQSFNLDIILYVLCNHAERRDEDVQVEGEFKDAIAVAQMLIGDFRRKLTQIENVDENTEEEMALSQSSLDKALDNVERIGTKANFDKEHMQPYVTEASWVCHTLGLEIDFLHCSGLDKLPERFADHLSIEEWICNFLEENYKAEKQLAENASLPDKGLLERIGFRADGDAVKTLVERTSTLKEHLHTFDWAEMYVRDEFKYNPVLSGLSPRFPFLRNIREEWLILPMVKGGDNLSYREVNVINLESRNSTSHTKQLDGCSSFPLDLEDETHKVLFHGTDHDSARDIFIHGARITLGRKNRDFSSGSGFYLTDDFEHSVEWAFCSTCKPVVLVYRMDRSLLEAFSGYSLVGEDKRNEWTDLVKQYRSGKPSKKLRKSVRDYDYIEGPRASSCDAASPEPKDGTYQMCVISDELAEALDGCLHSAVFYA